MNIDNYILTMVCTHIHISFLIVMLFVYITNTIFNTM